jgi:hypothetical protein
MDLIEHVQKYDIYCIPLAFMVVTTVIFDVIQIIILNLCF